MLMEQKKTSFWERIFPSRLNLSEDQNAQVERDRQAMLAAEEAHRLRVEAVYQCQGLEAPVKEQPTTLAPSTGVHIPVGALGGAVGGLAGALVGEAVKATKDANPGMSTGRAVWTLLKWVIMIGLCIAWPPLILVVAGLWFVTWYVNMKTIQTAALLEIARQASVRSSDGAANNQDK